jgi:endonuclease-3
MLSAQTKDETTAKAMIELQKIPLNVDNFLATDDQALEKMIYPVSFYRRKVQFIKKTSQILQDKYNSDIPDNVQDLMKLPGVGPKMAYRNLF